MQKNPSNRRTPLPPVVVDEFARLAGLCVAHPGWSDAEQEILDMHALRHGRQEGSGVMLLGEVGVGKSKLLEAVASRFPPYDAADRRCLPCLKVSIPPRPTIRGTVKICLHAMGDPYAFSGNPTADDLTSRLITMLHNCGTELILLDEVGHMVTGRRNDSIDALADWIKQLADSTLAPVVLAGIPASRAILESNEALRRRFSQSLELTLAEMDQEQPDITYFKLVVEAVATHLATLAHLDLEQESLFPRLLLATDGRIGYLMALLLRAARTCSMNDEIIITQNVLAESFRKQIWRAAPSIRNPFCDQFNWRRLNGAGEPFAPTASARSGKRKNS